MTPQRLMRLIDKIERETNARHERGEHDGCLVCEIAETIAESPSIERDVIEAIAFLVKENDARAMCVMLASFFVAGMQYGAMAKEQVQ